MPNVPGVRVVQEEVGQETQAADAELPTCVLGRLYHVVEEEVVSDAVFDPLEPANQVFEWPSKKLGSVVDLAGTRNGLIDSQRRALADFVPRFQLVDGQIVHSVDDGNVLDLNQDGFSIRQEARDGLERAEVEAFIVAVDNESFVYNPEGGFSDIQVGDKFEVGASSYTVASSTDSRIYTEEDLSGDAATMSRLASSNTVDVSVTPSTVAGRVVVDISGDDFTGINEGDVAVTGIPMQGFTSVGGTLATQSITGLDFASSIAFEEVENNVVRVVNGSDVFFTTLTALDTFNGTAEVADSVGTDGAVTISILRSQVGFVESVELETMTVVVPNTFSDSQTFVDTSSNTSAFDVYPELEVRASFRALRKDLANMSFTASTLSELLDAVGHTSVNSNDGLLFAVNLVINSQENERNVFFIPVDDEDDGDSGLVDNRDLATGYQLAFESAESIIGYNIVTVDRSPAIYSTLESHVLNMSTEDEGAWRRGFMYEPVPMGEFESTSGEIFAGRVTGGIGSGDDGNSVIRDENLDFITEADVVEGTKVVVTFPEVFAGEYQALATTTDNDLILDGDPFDVVKEFSVEAGMEVETVSGLHNFTNADPDQFAHVEAGDYVEATIDGSTFRMKIVSVLANGTGFTAQDEVPATISFAAATPVTDLSIIRTWNTVRYHIRPLSKEAQVDELINRKSVVNRRFTLTLDYSPTMVVGVDSDGNDVREALNPSLSLAGIAAKRSGLRAFDEVTNMFVGGGVESVTYGYNYFKKSQLKRLSDAGFTLLTQKSRDSQPYIRDMITTDTSNIVTQEEIVTAGADWQSKSLTASFTAPPGQRFQIIDDWLMGLRAVQADAILKNWVGEGRLTDYELIRVGRNELNKRQTDIVYIGYFPVAEKEIEFTIQITV